MNQPSSPTVDPPAYDIRQFCQAHHISRSLFYELVRAGRGPDLMRVGARVLISGEAARVWRQRMTAETRDRQTPAKEPTASSGLEPLQLGLQLPRVGR